MYRLIGCTSWLPNTGKTGMLLKATLTIPETV